MRCPNCNRDWHSAPLTQAQAKMWDSCLIDASYEKKDTPIECVGSDTYGPNRRSYKRIGADDFFYSPEWLKSFVNWPDMLPDTTPPKPSPSKPSTGWGFAGYTLMDEVKDYSLGPYHMKEHWTDEVDYSLQSLDNVKMLQTLNQPTKVTLHIGGGKYLTKYMKTCEVLQAPGGYISATYTLSDLPGGPATFSYKINGNDYTISQIKQPKAINPKG